MLEFALWFYQNYFFIFYLLLAIAVLLEWPIVIFTLTMLATKLGISLSMIFFLSIFGDFGGDLLHFLIGKYGRKLIKNKKKRISSGKIRKVKAKVDDYPLLEKLIIIKYTPPITSIGLLYLWSTKLSFKKFCITTLPLCLISSSLVFGVGLFFGHFLTPETPVWWFIVGIGLALFIIIKGFKALRKQIVMIITSKHKQATIMTKNVKKTQL